jgi:poly(3-hydroxybutyrate) depolymerase
MRIGPLASLLLALAACNGSLAQPSGAADAGGADDGAVAGAADGAGSDAGGPPPNADVVWPGVGCGKPLPANQMTATPGSARGYTHYVVMGTGTNLTDTPIATNAIPRTFWVRVPADYDPSHPYRVVYVGQGCGGYQMANIYTFQLYKESAGGTEQAIYVALDLPENQVNMDCYDNRSGPSSGEWEAFQLIQQFVDANYCADLNHIYVAGYSTGGYLANMWGCYFAGAPTPPRKLAPGYHIRAQIAVSGGEPPMQPTCGGPVAALILHDTVDSNPFSGALAALARVGRTNGCDTTYDDATLQVPWHSDVVGPDVCKKFVGCPAGYPVVFCTTTGQGHSDHHTDVIPAAKLLFDEIEAPR